MLIPIVKIKLLIESLLDYVVEDFQNHQDDEENTFLYKILNGTKDGNYDFYQQAKKIFTRTEDDPRSLSITYEYPKDRSNLPIYVIREPGKMAGPDNSIGKISGFDYVNGAPQYRDSRQSTYEIMCFSENMMESILMSEVLYALFIGAYDTFSSNFITVDFGLKELMMNNELMPTPIFIKSVTVTVSDDQFIPGLVDSTLLGKIIFGKVNQVDSFVYGEGNRIDGLPGVEAEITGEFC